MRENLSPKNYAMQYNSYIPDPIQNYLIKIIIDLGDESWAVGSGFILYYKKTQYLVTAFHNLSGGISAEAHFKQKFPPRPSRIELYYADQLLLSFVPYVHNKSLFTVHPAATHLRGCDVATINLHTIIPEGITIPNWNNTLGFPIGSTQETPEPPHHIVTDMFLPAGSNALVYGYPGGRDYNGRPIAVGSKIAAYDPNEPTILLSGYTSSGCSGGMVIARDTNGYLKTDSNNHLTRALNSYPLVDQLLGVYAGRLEGLTTGSSSFIRTHIGVVWTTQVILETIHAHCHSMC